MQSMMWCSHYIHQVQTQGVGNETHGLVDAHPGNGPISVSFNHFNKLHNPEVKFEVIDIFNCLVVCDYGVHPREDDVKIDCISWKDIILFGIREFGNTFGSENHALGGFDIEDMILRKFVGELLIRVRL